MPKEPSQRRSALVTEEKYQGKYVALESFNKNKVVAWGDDPSKVIHQARKKGAKSPVLVFVPEKGVSYVY
jgi:hypothetical protein